MVKLRDVLYIPDFPHCIFSVESATTFGSTVIFSENRNELIGPNGTVFPLSRISDCITSVNWQLIQSVQRISKHGTVFLAIVIQLTFRKWKALCGQTKFHCETSVMAKQPNVRNRNPDVRATEPFELVHTDLSGPIDPIAKDGFRYAIVFTDHYSSNMFTYFLSQMLLVQQRRFWPISPHMEK